MPEVGTSTQESRQIGVKAIIKKIITTRCPKYRKKCKIKTLEHARTFPNGATLKQNSVKITRAMKAYAFMHFALYIFSSVLFQRGEKRRKYSMFILGTLEMMAIQYVVKHVTMAPVVPRDI